MTSLRKNDMRDLLDKLSAIAETEDALSESGKECSCCGNKINAEGKCGCDESCEHCGGQHDLTEAYINGPEDVVELLGSLRAAGKALERGQQEYEGNLANKYSNDVYDVYTWLENHVKNFRGSQIEKHADDMIALRKTAKQLEQTEDYNDPHFANQVVNTVWPLLQWIDSNQHDETLWEHDLPEGHYDMPPMDKDRYQERDGLEGPFQTRSGKVVYYDPKEGSYYDPDSDFYLSYEEFMSLDNSKPDDFKITKIELPKSDKDESAEPRLGESWLQNYQSILVQR